MGVDGLLHMFQQEQLGGWQDRLGSYAQIFAAGRDRSGSSPSVFTLRFVGGDVELEAKQTGFTDPSQDPFLARAFTYIALFREAIAGRPAVRDVDLLLDTGDEAPPRDDCPVFTFQKSVECPNILLPDVEAVTSGYFSNVRRDEIPFIDKRCRATFAGSTTGGGLIDADVVRSESMPRLRAARFFKRFAAEVDFRLVHLVQCASPEVEALLRAEGFGGAWIDWQEAYASKFAISIDGNGAACSRPAIILLSNSVLLKYRSDKVLYYSSAFADGVHYIAIEEDEQVVDVVRRENQEPGRHEKIATAGRTLAESILTRKRILDYTYGLLAGFAEMANPT